MNFYIKKNSNIELEKKKIIDKIISYFRENRKDYKQKKPKNIKDYDLYVFNKVKFTLDLQQSKKFMENYIKLFKALSDRYAREQNNNAYNLLVLIEKMETICQELKFESNNIKSQKKFLKLLDQFDEIKNNLNYLKKEIDREHISFVDLVIKQSQETNNKK